MMAWPNPSSGHCAIRVHPVFPWWGSGSNRVDPVDGCIPVPTGPGLGIEVIPEAVREFSVETITLR